MKRPRQARRESTRVVPGQRAGQLRTSPGPSVLLSLNNPDRQTAPSAGDVASRASASVIRSYLKAARQHGSTAARQHGSTAARQHGSTAARQHGSTAARQHGSTAARQHGSTAARQHGSTAARQHGSTAARQHGSTAARQHGSTAARQHGSTAARQHGLASSLSHPAPSHRETIRGLDRVSARSPFPFFNKPSRLHSGISPRGLISEGMPFAVGGDGDAFRREVLRADHVTETEGAEK